MNSQLSSAVLGFKTFHRNSSRNLTRNNSRNNVESIIALTNTRPKLLNRSKGLTIEASKEDETLQFYYSPLIIMDKISKIIYDVIDVKIKSDPDLLKYNSRRSKLLAQVLANEVKKKLKTSMEMMQYRIVTLVSLFPKLQQGVDYKMSFHADYEVDHFGHTKYETSFLFVVGAAYMIYKD